MAIPGLPGGRVYIINSPALVLAVQRQPKKLSFWAVEATFAVGLAGLSKYAEKELQDNVTGEEPRPSLFMVEFALFLSFVSGSSGTLATLSTRGIDFRARDIETTVLTEIHAHRTPCNACTKNFNLAKRLIK